MNPIGGRNFTFSRFYRHAFLLSLDAFDSATMNRIFATISEWHFSQGFSDKVTLLAKVRILISFDFLLSTHLEQESFSFFSSSNMDVFRSCRRFHRRYADFMKR